MNKNNFWDDTWKNVDSSKITSYVNSMSFASDRMIEILKMNNVKKICDAGCGCGAYSKILLNNGFEVYGFDVSEDAVKIAKKITKDRDHFAARNICNIGFDGNQFDAVISRDVLDHMTKEDAKMALHELLRITRPGGIVCFTLNSIDDEYMSEIHDTDHEGNLIYTEGKWKGMVFHPFNKEEIVDFIPSGLQYSIEQENESFLVTVQK